MRLLVVIQKVDEGDENLGAFYRWFEELAHRVEHLTIIAGSAGKSHLPANVSVYILGKRTGFGRLFTIWKFWELFSYHYARADAVLFHQIPEYILAALPFLLTLSRTSALWYAHKSVTWKLRIAEHLVDYILTSSAEGFRLPSKKVLIVGQAIDTEAFRPVTGNQLPVTGLRMLTVGRISPVKNYDVLIRACSRLKDIWEREWLLSIVGGPIIPKDREYMSLLKKSVKEAGLENRIHFLGARPYSEVPSIYQEHDLFLNLSRTGSLDKAVLEAMAAGLNVISANEAYCTILPPPYFLEHISPELLAERIKIVADLDRPSPKLREIVVKDHGLKNTIGKIYDILSSTDNFYHKLPISGGSGAGGSGRYQ